MIKFIRIFLFVLIIIGIGLLITEKTWVPKLVDQIIKSEEAQKVATKDIITYSNASSDLITVELPFPGAVTGKDFSIIGKARGTWYFEASFPITILDKDNKVLVNTYAQAQGEWMTENFVPFRSDVKIPETYIGPATIVLQKDNPSDMREKDAYISFPIIIEY